MRYKLTIAYHGGPFKGWQRQKNSITVQGEIERALKLLFGAPIDVFGSGRTDQGVHAMGQVAHIDIPKPMDPYALMRGLNHFLQPHIAVRSVDPIHETFHARFDAVSRTYHYHIYPSVSPSPLLADRAWNINQPLCVDLMQHAAQSLVGMHDFSAFRSHACQSKSPVRTLDAFELISQDDGVAWRVKARSFLHHQVRFMVGALVYVGLGKESPSWVSELLQQKTAKPFKAPAHGLCLMKIEYPEGA